MSFDGELPFDPDPYSGKRKNSTRQPHRLGPCGCGCLLLIGLFAAVTCLVTGTLLGFGANEVINDRENVLATELALALTQTALARPPATEVVVNPPTLPPSLTPTRTRTPTVTPLPTNTPRPQPPTPSRTPTLTAEPRTVIAPILSDTATFSQGEVVWSGDVIAVAGGDTITLFDANALGREGVVMTTRSDILDIAFSHDGELLAAAGADGNVLLWNIADPNRPAAIAQLTAPSGPIWSVAFDPQNRWLAAGTDDGKIRIWQIQDRVEVYTETIQSGPVFALAFDTDGTELAAGGGQQVRLLDVQPNGSLQPNRSISVAGDVLQAVFSPDSTHLALATSSDSGTLELWHLAPDQRIAQTGHKSRINHVLFSNDGLLLMSGSADGSVRLWILAGAEVLAWHVLPHNSQVVVSVAINAAATQLISLTQDNTLTLWDIATGNPLEQRQL